MATQKPLEEVINKYILYQFLEASVKSSFFPNENTESYKQTIDDFSRFCQAVLSNSLHTPETVESMMWVISNYAYKELKVDSRFHLASHMRHGARGEASLYMMKEFYRDHFFHTIEVCFLGHLLINTTNKKGQNLLDSKLLKDWYLAALLHDIGYAIDICKALTDWLNFFSSTSFKQLHTNIKSAIESNRVQNEFQDFFKKYGFSDDFKPWEDHGVVGAHHLQSLYDDIDKKHSVSNIENTLQAIVKHNCHEIIVNYKDEPLTVLLILCDTLQVWGRPQFLHFSQGPAWIMSYMYNTFQNNNMPKPVRASLLSNISFEDSKGEIKPVFKKSLILRLVFGETVNNNSLLFNIWLDTLSNLQRIDFRNLPFDILLQVQSPCYYSPGAKIPKAQLSRLIDVATDTHMAYLNNFFEYTTNEKINIEDVNHGNHTCCLNKTICYHTIKIEGKYTSELISFNLKKFDGQKQYMTESLSRFRDDYKNWKLYNEDRLFEGDYSPWNHKKK